MRGERMGEYQHLTTNYNIKKYSDNQFRLTILKYPGSKREKERATSRNVNDKKLDNHISRARTKIYEYALCNDWEYFVTMTINPEKYDRKNTQEYIKDLGQWIRDGRKKGKDISYLLVPDPHKDGSIHLHGLMNGFTDTDIRLFDVREKIPKKIKSMIASGRQIYDIPEYQSKFGWVTAEKVRDKDAIAKYITKYVTKSLKMDLEREKEKKLYYNSRGLKTALKMIEGTLPPSTVKSMPTDFENDYVKIKLMSNNELIQFLDSNPFSIIV